MTILAVYVLFITSLFCSAQNTKQLQAQLACNGELSFYDQEKILLFIENPTNISSNYTLYPRNEVLAVRCRNSKSKPWIIGSVSNGIVTDTRWKCTGLAKREPLNFKWWQDKADDSNWAQAVANFSNRGDSPWRKVWDISEDAFWISTANEDDVRIFCRRRLSDVFLKRTSFSKGIFQTTLEDVDYALSSHPRSEHEVNDVMHCYKKCQDDPKCLSFNFEYTSSLPSKNCELNGVTKRQDPNNYVKRPGYIYYENVEY
ncbi:hypothetical protein ABFA07_001156 [Porites harrisoni]